MKNGNISKAMKELGMKILLLKATNQYIMWWNSFERISKCIISYITMNKSVKKNRVHLKISWYDVIA